MDAVREARVEAPPSLRSALRLSRGTRGLAESRVGDRNAIDGVMSVKERLQNEDVRETLPDRFDVRERLGTGAFGTVFRALDRKRRSVVALKVLHDMHPDRLYQFKREFRALTDISHPNLIDLYELVGSEEVWFFSMDYVDGVHIDEAFWTSADENVETDDATRSVDDPSSVAALSGPPQPTPDRPKTGERLEQKEREPAVYSERRVRKVFAGLARGLVALHEHGNLHRDLKPGNVLVDSDDRVTLLDFGLVAEREVPRKARAESDPDSAMAGTPRYLAPELATDMPLTEATDWYSAGVMLYEILAGQPPIEGRTTVQELFLKNTREPTDVREFAPEVSDELAEVCMELLAIDPEDRPDGKTIVSRLGIQDGREEVDTSQPIPAVESGSSTFVGRDTERRRLERMARETFEEGVPTIAHVCGESGVGKSALVRRFLDEIGDSEVECRAIWNRCHENESVPYKVFDGVIDELVPLVAELPDEEVVATLGDGLSALARLFPVLRRVDVIASEDVPLAALSEAEIREKGFRALRGLFERLAESYQLVICIDDVQWGDEDSVLLLEYLLGGDDPPPIMLVMTWRESDAETSPFLVECLDFDARLQEHVRIEYLELSGLSQHEARELALRLTPAGGVGREEVDASETVEEIVRESEGHPLFVSELSRRVSRSMATGSELADLDQIWVDRFEGLAEPAQRMLEVVAVAGRPLDRELVRAVSEVTEEELSSLSSLRSQRLLLVKGAESEHLETYHDRVREIVLDRLSGARTREIHRHVADALLTRGDPDPAKLADHLEAAGENERAAAYTVEAAERALDSLAFERGARLLERALRLGDWSRARRYELSRQVADLYRTLGHGGRAVEAFQTAADLAEGLDVQECRLQACEQMLRVGSMDRGRELLYDQLEALGFSPVDGRFRMLLSILYNRWRLERRGFEYELRELEEIPRRERLLLRGMLTATTMFGVTDIVRGTYFHYHALRRSLDSGFPTGIAALFCQQAAQDVSRGVQIERAEGLLERAEQLFPHCDTAWGDIEALHTFICGVAEYFRGEWVEGLEGIRDSIAIYEESYAGYVWETELFRVFAFDSLEYLGRFEELRRETPRKLEQALERGDSFHVLVYRTKLAIVCLCDGEPERAERILSRARDVWDGSGFHVQHFWIYRVGVEAALYRGNLAEARDRLEGGWGPLRRSLLLQTRTLAAEAWSLYGRVAVSEYARSSGWAALRARVRIWRAGRQLRSTGLDWGEAYAELLEGRLFCAKGDTSEARATLERAEKIFDDSDMTFHARSVQWYRGQLAGGEEGRERVRHAREWMQEKGIKEPARMARRVVGIEGRETELLTDDTRGAT